MFALATKIETSKYDVIVWASEAESINDDGANAVARKTVTCGDNVDGDIRAAMGLDSDSTVEIG